MLPNNDIVRKVYTNPEDGILAGLLPGTFLIDSSTVDPAVSKEVAELSKVNFLKLRIGLYMIGYGTGKIILKFPPFCQMNEEYQERENSK